MKLRNKKTNEEVEINIISDSLVVCHADGEMKKLKLSDLKDYEECGDVPEEPKGYWYVDDAGVMQIDQVLCPVINMRKSIGNYFETKEEAEKAVEKLKAWKRLKDARFKFTDFGYNLDELSSSTIGADGKICFEMMCYEDFADDLELFFGGEE